MHKHSLLPDPFLPDSMLGSHYRIVQLLSHTQLSSVYLAHDQMSQRQVVVKRLAQTLRPGGLLRKTAIQAFVREARTLARLHHPQIPSIYATLRAGTDCFMVLEYIQGARLDTIIDTQKLSKHQKYMLARALCNIVAYLHQQQPSLIHADIKPTNVVVTEDGNVVLLDFGLAHAVDPYTYTNEPIGSLPYAPPEQQAGVPLDVRSDLYSLGVTLQELFAPIIDVALNDVLRRATAPLRTTRYANVIEFQHALMQTYLPQSSTEPNILKWRLLVVLTIVILEILSALRPPSPVPTHLAPVPAIYPTLPASSEPNTYSSLSKRCSISVG